MVEVFVLRKDCYAQRSYRNWGSYAHWSRFCLLCILWSGVGCAVFAQQLPESLLVLGKGSYQSGDYTKAIQYYKAHLAWADKLGKELEKAETLRLIGDAFRASGELESAMTQLQMGLEIAQHLDDTLLVGRFLNRISAVEFELNQLESCESHGRQAAAIGRKWNDIDLTSSSLNILGAVYRAKGEYDKAIQVLESAKELIVASGDSSDLPSILNNIANTHLHNQQHQNAISVATQSYEIAHRMQVPAYEIYAAEILFKVYKQLGDFTQALHWNEIFTHHYTQLQDQKRTEEIGKLRKDLDLKIKESENQRLKTQNELHQQELHSRSQRDWAIAASAILGLGLAFVFFFVARRQKHVNEELKRQNDLIEQQTRKIESINTQLVEKAGHLEDTIKVKDKLFSIISHDLRSPLNSIQGLLDLLRMDQLGTKEFKFMTDNLINRVDNTTILLDNLLIWSRSQMDGFAMKPEVLDVARTLGQIEHLLAPNFKAKGIELVIQLPEGLKVICDHEMLSLILRNLLSNALKFSPAGTQVTVVGLQKDGFVEVSVIDQGKGISKDELEKINQQGYYSTNGTSNEKGSGLGLKLCREFLVQNQGNLFIRANAPKGTQVGFTLLCG